MPQRVVLFELNEVPWRVLDDIAREQPRSNIAKLLGGGHQFETHAPDTALSPWITWPTLHRGVTDEEHTISDFGQDLADVDTAYPPIWRLLSAAGIDVGVGGSLHTFPPPGVGDPAHSPDNYAFYLPDVFASAPDSIPHELEAFQAFNLQMSRASARNVAGDIPAGSAARFLAAAPSLGIKPRTAAGLAKQLAAERVRPWQKVRRRTWQSILAFDIYMQALEKTRPAFSTFFTNHVASSMHRFWAARYPGDYAELPYSDEWMRHYQGEIGWTMGRFDRMLGRLMDHAQRTGAVLWVASSMGQAAVEAQSIRTQVYLSDLDRFMTWIGLEPSDWERRPAMLPRVIVKITESKRQAFARALSDGIQIGEHGPLPWKELDKGVYRMHPGTLFDAKDEHVRRGDETVPFATAGFENVEVQDGANSNAYHIPEGSLIIWDPSAPRRDEGRPRISTVDVAPSLLRHFGQVAPKHMPGSTDVGVF